MSKWKIVEEEKREGGAWREECAEEERQYEAERQAKEEKENDNE